MDTQIIKDFLPFSYQNEIKNEMLATRTFPWYWNPSTVDSSKQYEKNTHIGNLENGRDDIQMYHLFINSETKSPPSHYFNLVRHILYFLELKIQTPIKEVIRIKGNLLFTTNGQQGGSHIPHIDQYVETGNCLSMVYYVNDSDGDTITYNEKSNGSKQTAFTVEKTCTPKQGTAILLESDRYHSSSLPVNTDTRCVINFIFKI